MSAAIFRLLGSLSLPLLAGFTAYSIDQTRYFPSPTIESAELQPCLDAAAAFPAVAPAAPAALVAYLHQAESLLSQLQRHGAYLHLRASIDIDDQSAADAADRTSDAEDQIFDSVSTGLHALGGAGFAHAAASEPALIRYGYLQQLADRSAAHRLPPAEEAILNELADPAASNAWTLYQQTVRNTPFAILDTAEGPLNVKTDSRLLALNADRNVRHQAWQARLDGFNARSDIYATILLGIVRMNDRVARLRHFPDAPTQVYFERGLERDEVNAALAAIESHADLIKHYQGLRAQHIEHGYAIADVQPWDTSLPAPGFTIPRMTLDETRTAVLAALQPLGKDYVEHFRQLLEPANGRMDIAAEQGKRTNGGFSLSAPNVASGLFVENYGRGLLGDSRVIIHEGGHAIHKQLMSEGGVSPFYRRGPNWMFEAFATLNEFLLYDHLYRTSTTLKARAYYLEPLIDDMTFQLFTSAEEARLEQSIHDGVIAGRIKNAADLNRLSDIWATKSLMFQDPLYLVNYLYSGLLATQMLDRLEHRPAEFRRRYDALLRHGFDAPPQDLLRTFFGDALSQQALVDSSMNSLQRRIDALAEIYRQIDPQLERRH